MVKDFFIKFGDNTVLTMSFGDFVALFLIVVFISLAIAFYIWYRNIHTRYNCEGCYKPISLHDFEEYHGLCIKCLMDKQWKTFKERNNARKEQ